MSDIKNFLDKISQKDWSAFQIPVTSENESNKAVPYLIQNSAIVTCEILKEYHKWITENYDITPKN